MNILEKIVAHKRIEIEEAKAKAPLVELQKNPLYKRKSISLASALIENDSSGIISEFKRKSPSKGWIHQDADLELIAQGYQEAGVSGMSCLTDAHFFGGSHRDFEAARNKFKGPMLRKDFIIDEYQVHESKSMGADVILLIAAILEREEVVRLTSLAHTLDMEVLLEVHNKDELTKYYPKVDMVGINNRDLRDFSVSLLTSIDLKRYLPENAVLVSESGLEHPGIVADLFAYGFKGFLIGEYFMKHKDPGKKAMKFILDLQQRKKRRA